MPLRPVDSNLWKRFQLDQPTIIITIIIICSLCSLIRRSWGSKRKAERKGTKLFATFSSGTRSADYAEVCWGTRDISLMSSTCASLRNQRAQSLSGIGYEIAQRLLCACVWLIVRFGARHPQDAEEQLSLLFEPCDYVDYISLWCALDEMTGIDSPLLCHFNSHFLVGCGENRTEWDVGGAAMVVRTSGEIGQEDAC